MTETRMIIIVLLELHLISMVVTQVMISEYPFRRWKNGAAMRRLLSLSNILLNTVFFVVITSLEFRSNVFQTILALFKNSISYQTVVRLAESNAACMLFSIVLGVVLFAAACLYYQEWMRLRWNRRFLLLAAIWIFPLLVAFSLGMQGNQLLSINEVCRLTADDSAEVFSWGAVRTDSDISYVVIRNDGVFANELTDLYLTEEGAEIPAVPVKPAVVEPGGCYTYTFPANRSLAIRKRGGTVLQLLNSGGKILDELEVPALDRDESWRKTEFGWQLVDLSPNEIQSRPVAAPGFSTPGGFYNHPFRLFLSAEPGTVIYYTLDGSDPTTQSQRYSAPLTIADRSAEPDVYRAIRNVRRNYLQYPRYDEITDKAAVVRAIAVDAEGNQSDISTSTYFIGLAQYSSGMTLSLVSDPDGLFNSKTGIYVTGEAYDAWYQSAYVEGQELDKTDMPEENYLQNGEAWERPANLEVFMNGVAVSEQPVGIRIQGHGVRYANTLKRFSIYSRERYSGSTWFDYPFFGERNIHDIYLRQGDLFAVCQELMKDRAVSTIVSRPVNVFLDGEFWYSTYLFEKFSEKNLAQLHGISPDNVVMVKNGEAPAETKLGANPYSAISTFLARYDLSDDAAYERFGRIIDISSYTEMVISNFYFANMDVREEWNNCAWHTIIPEGDTVGDTRWRWALYDMDLQWGALRKDFSQGTANYEIDPFTMYGLYQDRTMLEWPIFSKLCANANYRKLFVNTYLDLRNTALSAESAERVLDSLEIYDNSIRTFFRMRPDTSLPFVVRAFGLTGSEQTVSVRSDTPAKVGLNTLKLELSGETVWQGRYLTDYPITLSTEEPNFLQWEVVRNGQTEIITDPSAEITITQGGVQIHAVFQ